VFSNYIAPTDKVLTGSLERMMVTFNK